MIVVRDRERNYKIVFSAKSEYELSYWVRRHNIDINSNRFSVQHIDNIEYYTETKEEKIRKNRDIIIDDLLKDI